MRIKEEHIECEKYSDWVYWQGGLLGLAIGFGFNAMILWKTHIGNINIIFTTIFFSLFIANIVLRLRTQTKLDALRGNQDE